VEACVTQDGQTGMGGFTGSVEDLDALCDALCETNPTLGSDNTFSFYIPLGFGVFDGAFPSDTFVSVELALIGRVDQGDLNVPMPGGPSMQAMGTLQASVPVVSGGVASESGCGGPDDPAPSLSLQLGDVLLPLPQFAHCSLPLSWPQLSAQRPQAPFGTGGLGRLLQPGVAHVWVCIRDDGAPVSGDCGPGFCFVYHEQEKAFVAWGPNSELQLLPIEEEEERV